MTVPSHWLLYSTAGVNRTLRLYVPAAPGVCQVFGTDGSVEELTEWSRALVSSGSLPHLEMGRTPTMDIVGYESISMNMKGYQLDIFW
jgi:hypothetical protein